MAAHSSPVSAPFPGSSNSAPLVDTLNSAFSSVSDTLFQLPGSSIVLRYIRSSYQGDPMRSLLELILVIFAIRTILQSRTRGGSSGTNFVKLSKKEIDDLVDEFNPEPLCAPLSPIEQQDLLAVPTIIGGTSSRPKISLPSHHAGKPKEVMNLASYNFSDLAGNEKVKERAVMALRKYGVGSCSPPGFYGTIDVHMALEADIARFLGTDKCIIYSQGFSTISSVIPAFCKRGDIVVADRGVNFAIQKGLQISRSTLKWYNHNSISSLESVLQSIVKEDKRRRGPLTRRFIVTEGIFEGDGAKVDLAKLLELKRKYKFRLILDESISFGTVGATGRGMTELCEVPASEIDMLVGSMANTLGSAGGFCAGSEAVVFHQRINGTSFVFSAALPAMMAVASSTAIQHLISQPSILSTLQENIRTLRGILDHIESIYIPSDIQSPLIHIQIRSKHERHPDTSSEKHANSLVAATPTFDGHDLDIQEQSRLLQAIVEDALEHGVFLIRHKKLTSINPKVLETSKESRPSIRIAVSAAFSKKEMEKAGNVIKSSTVKMIGKRR
ncbi:hypothetical protein CBS101457_006593 [Exobasidium rhododendri]|nr:hypothetical protein CBS101457_006593 [Exobasidium rhododendri]